MKKILLSLLVISSVVSAKSLDEQLFDACVDGDVAEVKSLIEQGADVNMRHEKDGEDDYYSGYTPLLVAMVPEIVKMLINAGAEVDAKDSFGERTRLCQSVWTIAWESNYWNRCEIEMEILEILIAANADVNVADFCGRTPLMKLFDINYTEGLVNDPERHQGYQERQLHLIQVLIDAGANVNTLADNGRGALYYCVSQAEYRQFSNNGLDEHNTQVMMLLISAGADINVKDVEGRSILMHLVMMKRHDVDADNKIMLLINAEANVDAKDIKGYTALMYATELDDIEAEKLLISAGADINAKDNVGKTVLMHSYGTSTKYLIDAGADIDTKAPNGKTALTLIALGALWHIEDRSFYYAHLYFDGIRNLLSNGAKVTEKDLAMINIIIYELEKHERSEG